MPTVRQPHGGLRGQFLVMERCGVAGNPAELQGPAAVGRDEVEHRALQRISSPSQRYQSSRCATSAALAS